MKTVIDDKDPVLFEQFKKLVQEETGMEVGDITQIIVDIPTTQPTASPEMLAKMFLGVVGKTHRKLI